METPESTADPDDVRDIIETSLSDTVIDRKLGHAAARNEAANKTEVMTAYEKGRIEALLTAIEIRSTTDRAISSGQSESSTVSYEGSALEYLRAELHELDPSNTLATGVRRDSNRNITRSSPPEASESEER